MATILYIEDDAEHRLMIGEVLTSRGFTVETAQDGLEGVEKTLKLRPDLVLLDLYLPHMDGFSVITRLKGDPLTSDIPIIVISAWPTGDNRKRVQDSGAAGFIAKPFKVEMLINIIQKNLAQ